MHSDPPSRNFLLRLSVVACIAGLLPVILLGFKIDSLIVSSKAISRGYDQSGAYIRTSDQSGLDIALYPRYLSRSANKPLLAAAGVSLALALCTGCFARFIARRAKAISLSKPPRYLCYVAVTGSFVLSLVVFITLSIQHLGSADFVASYRSPATNFKSYGPSDIYDGGVFDLYTWSCQLNGHGTFVPFKEARFTLARQCIDEAAAFWTVFLSMIFNGAMAGLVLFDWKGQRVLIRDYRLYEAGNELDYI